MVAKSKEDATISAIGMDLMTDNVEYDIGDLGSASDSDFDFNPAEYDNFGCSTIVATNTPDTSGTNSDSDPEYASAHGCDFSDTEYELDIF